MTYADYTLLNESVSVMESEYLKTTWKYKLKLFRRHVATVLTATKDYCLKKKKYSRYFTDHEKRLILAL